MNPSEKTPSEPSFEQMLSLRSEHCSAYIRLIAEATESIAWLDDNYSESGINGLTCATQLREFLLGSSKRRVRVLTYQDQFLATKAPRFTSLLKTFSQQITVRLVHPEDWQGQAMILADGRHVLNRPQADRWRGFLAFDASAQSEPLALKFDRLWDNAAPCLGPTTLGL